MFKKKWLLPSVFTSNIPSDFFETKTDSVSRKDTFLSLKALFDSNDISTFVVLGTCLGFVRGQDFIEYDHDMDFAFYEDDIYKLKNLVSQLGELGFFIEEVCPCNLRIQSKYCKNTCDLWIIHKVKNPIYRLLGYKWLYNNGLFKTDYFNTTIKNNVTVFDIPIRVPNDVNSYLVEHYGESWRTPQKGMNAIYRGLLSQILNKLFFHSPMPSKFSGVNENLVFKPWVSFILKRFAPNAALTKRHKHL